MDNPRPMPRIAADPPRGCASCLGQLAAAIVVLIAVAVIVVAAYRLLELMATNA